MRAREFIVERDLEEGWKERAIGAGVIGAGLAGAFGPGVMKNIPKGDNVVDQPRPAVTQQYKQTPQIVEPQTQPAPIAQPNIEQPPTTIPAPVPTANPVFAPKVKISAPIKYKEEDLRPTIEKVAKNAGLHGKELAQFLAQVKVETAGFTRMAEIGNDAYFTAHYDLTKNPAKAKILGNTEPGDGIKYKGRGPLQITGKGNYASLGNVLGLPLVDHPELLEKPEIGAQAAVYYWKHRVRPNVKNFSNTKQTTQGINPALKGLANRFQAYKDEWNRMMGNKPSPKPVSKHKPQVPPQPKKPK